MRTVRSICPDCDIVTIEATRFMLRQRRGLAYTEAVFTCPSCAHEVVHPLVDDVVPALVDAGCPMDDGMDAARRLAARLGALGDDPEIDGSGFGAELTEAEIACFVADLERADWFEELLA